MKIFNLDKRFSVVCNFENTRNGFRHTGALCSNGNEVYKTKLCYLNRTWECYEFESILEKVIGERFTGAEIKAKDYFLLEEFGIEREDND